MALEAGRANDRCRKAKAALEEATKIVNEGEIELHELADTLYEAHMTIETQKHKVLRQLSTCCFLLLWMATVCIA